LAVIMGGGRGTRLAPLTQERCKPAVPLAGKYRLVDIPISNCINSDINRIFLLTQFNTASLHRHIQGAYQFDPFGGGFRRHPLGRADGEEPGLVPGDGRRRPPQPRPFPRVSARLILILSGDQLYRMDFREIIEQHLATGADVTVAAKPFPVSRVEGLGLMRVGDDLSIQQFVEKPKDPAVIAGLALSPAIEASLKEPTGRSAAWPRWASTSSTGPSSPRRSTTAMTDFGREVIPSLLGRRSSSRISSRATGRTSGR
jgi:glucose-1-phosphate adenylyltransferase